jgi:2-polyprenyl-3-methyl-5-hydroxy-6-metoxy-1,4-benzoquinol methylase
MDEHGVARDAFVERVFQANLAVFDVFSMYVGERLGLYRVLADRGPLTGPELAEAAGIDPRYAREWLEQQAATAILLVDDVVAAPDARRFSLPAAHAEVLIDPESPYAMSAVSRSIASLGLALPALLEAFRTGDGVSWDGLGDDMVEAQGDFNRPWLVGQFATEYLPSIPDLHARLQAGARVADIAAGVGWAGIAIARAYPSVHVDGFDTDAGAIERARRNAADAGLDDRLHFEVRDATDVESEDRYDLAVVVEAIHDMSNPVEVLASIRRMLKEDGSLIVADERVNDSFTAPADDRERLFYGYSVFSCLPSGMLAKPSAGTGTVMRRSTFERYAVEAGFRSVAVLAIEHEFLRFYRLEP